MKYPVPVPSTQYPVSNSAAEDWVCELVSGYWELGTGYCLCANVLNTL
jgi:hypothetical protein